MDGPIVAIFRTLVSIISMTEYQTSLAHDREEDIIPENTELGGVLRREPFSSDALSEVSSRDTTTSPSRLGTSDDYDETSKNRGLALLAGQCIALLAASMNVTSYTLVHHYHFNGPLFMMFWMYLLLTLHLFCSTRCLDDEEERFPFPGCSRLLLRKPWWIYLLVSVLDVSPNFMMLVSFRFTSLTSTTLLGSLTVPSTMLFSRIILGRTFRPHHFAGVVLCCAGGSLTLYSDTSDEGPTHNRETSWVGDLLALVSAVCYGLGDTVSEYFIKRVNRHEYLGMIGLFGVLCTGLTFPWLEQEALRNLALFDSRREVALLPVLGLIVLYVFSVLFYYMAEAKFLVSSDATLLNLSMQSVNLWAVLFAAGACSDVPSPPFFVALVLVAAGVCAYELGCCCGSKQRQIPEAEAVVDRSYNLAIDYQSLLTTSTHSSL